MNISIVLTEENYLIKVKTITKYKCIYFKIKK